MATKENLAKRREETAKTHMQDLINREKKEKERVQRAADAKNREDALKMDFRQNMSPKIIGSLFGDDNPQQAKGVNTPITSVAPTYSTSTPQIQPVAAPKEETTQQGVPAMPSKKVVTSTPPPVSPSPQEQVIETPKENSVLTPEQSAAERNRMVAEVAEPLAQQGKENLQRLNLAQINKMTAEASARGQAKLEAEREAEEKRQRRNALLNAIGDGVAAMTNLYFTSKGAPNVAYDPRNSLSARSQARYDKINAERKADEEKAYLRRQNELKLHLDTERQRKAEERQTERDRIADERYEEEKKRQERQFAATLANQKAIAELNAQNQLDRVNATQAGQNYRANISAETQKQKSAASTANAKRGKPLQFSDGKNTVSIYENVWKPSMQQVYDAMVADGVEDVMLKYGATAAQIENFVKQNWTKSTRAKDLMKILSKIDPAAEYSDVEEEDFSQYEVGNDEDFSQYEVK